MAEKDKVKKTKKKDKKEGDPAGEKKSSSVWKKLFKIFAWTMGSIVVLLMLAVIFRDGLIKFGVTGIGSWVTGVEIALDSVDTSLSAGSVELQGLRIGNPGGFKRPNMLELEQLYVEVDLATLNSSELVINVLQVKNLEVTAEFSNKGRFNVTALTDNLKRRFPPQEKSTDDTDSREAVPPEKKKDVAVLIRDFAVNLKLNMVHDFSGASLVLPISYSKNDLRIAPDNDTPWIEKLDAGARRFEEFCQSCFNAGALIVSAGVEAGEDLHETIKSGIKSGGNVLNQGKALWNSATDVFKR